MPSVTYVEHTGARHEVDVPNGTSLMQAAIDNGIQGIVGECGGGLACATCHCYVEEAWMEKVGAASEMEQQMLEFANNSKSNSRLSCQINMSDELDGLVVELPESQF
jgi:2Fe-2S ferredoxin